MTLLRPRIGGACEKPRYDHSIMHMAIVFHLTIVLDTVAVSLLRKGTP